MAATPGCSTTGGANAAFIGFPWRRRSECGIHEKLAEVENIRISYSSVKQALQGAGLVARRHKWGRHRPLPGCCCTDGRKHLWFQDGRYYDLIVIMDDATSEMCYTQLVEEESTRTVMAVRDAKRRRSSGQEPADAVREGPAGTGHSHDCGLLAAGAGPQ